METKVDERTLAAARAVRGSRFCKGLVAAFVSCCLALSGWCASGTWLDPRTGTTWTFDYAGTDATITGGTGYRPVVLVPEEVYVGTTRYTVTAIGDQAFDATIDASASTISSVAIPSTVHTIGERAFYGCSSLVYVELNHGLYVIKANAFQNAVNLPGIVIPRSVDVIEDGAFSGCSALEAVEFVGNAANICYDDTYLGAMHTAAVFAGTPFLDSVNVNDNLMGAIGIGGAAGRMRACNILATLETGEPTTVDSAMIGKTLWWAWTAPAGVNKVSFYTYGSSFDTVMGAYTGSGFPLTKVKENDDRATNPYTSFVSFDVTPNTTYYICVGGAFSTACGTINLAWEATSNPFSLVVVDDTVIGFAGLCPESVTIPDSVTNIVAYAFSHDIDTSVDNLKSVVIPESVVKIGDEAFYECLALSSVTFENVEVPVDMDIDSAFYNTPYLDSLYSNDDFANAIQLTGSSGSAMGWNELASDQLGEPAATKNNSLWWKWKPPAGVTKAVFHTYGSDFDTVLGVYTGSAVDALTEVAYNDNVSVGRYNNSDTSWVEFDVAPDTDYYICVGGANPSDAGTVKLGWEACGSGGFSLVTWDDALLGFVGTCPASVVVPDGIALIEQSAFDQDEFAAAANLKSVFIPESMEIIADYAFYKCSQLASVTFEDDALSIDMDPYWVFYMTPFLAEVNKNDDWADAIELTGAKGSVSAWNAFATPEVDEPLEDAGHTLWWKWTAPDGVTKVMFNTHGSAFDTVLGVYTGAAVDALTEVAFNDDRGGTTSLVSFDVTPSETYYICVSGYSDKRGGDVKLTWEASNAFSLVVVDGVLIGFLGKCPASLTIPDTVTMIGDSAFDYYCDDTVLNLTSLVIPGSVTNIGYTAFSECEYLASVTFNEGLRMIDSYAFYGCRGLAGQTIVLPTTLEEIYDDAFEDVDGKLTLDLPRSLNGTLASGSVGTTDLTVRYYVKATLDPNGGELAGDVRTIYGDVYGDLSPLPTRTGHTFKGWKNGGTAITAATALPDVATLTLTAEWQVNQYKQTFDANGGVGGKTLTQDYGSALKAPTVTRTGYTFVGWTPAVPAKVPAKDVTYKAQWQVITETVTLDLGGGTGSGSATVNYGTKVSSLPVPARDHYEFVGWFAEDGTPVPGDTLITANLKLSARWKAVYYLYGDVGGAVPAVAATYDGYLYRDEEIAGTITVKVGKPNKKNGLASVKATVELAGGKKTLKAAGNGKALMAGDAPTTVALAGGEACEVTLGSDGIKGTYGAYGIDGARNVFVSKDSQDKAAASSALRAWQGAVTVAWEGAQGWNGISVSIAGKGKVKVSGNLADGTKVSAKGQLVAGEEWCCVPVLETKKSHLAFMLWLPLDASGTALPGTIGLGDGVKAGKPRYLRGDPPTFHVDSAAFNAMWGQAALPYLPNGVPVRGGVKWDLPKAGKVVYVKGTATVDETKLGDNPSALKLKYKSKDGTFSGSFKAYAEVSGKPKGTTVNVTGVLVDGVGYGTAAVKTVGRVPVTLE